MNLGRIIPHINSNFNSYISPWRSRSNVDNLETSKGIFYDDQNLYSNRRYEYYINLIRLFDEAIEQDNLHVLSIEQQKLLEQYFAEADPITPPITIPLYDWVYDWDSLHRRILDLDTFLGSYIGDNDGQFTEYRKKQFHC